MTKACIPFALMSIALLALFALNIFHGTVYYSPFRIWQILTGEETNTVASFIVLQSRLPQAVVALLSGAALAVSGLLLQTVFANPLADSSILGINAGASLGVAVVMLLFGGSFVAGSFALPGFFLVLVAAFIGSGAIIMLLLLLSAYVKNGLMLLIVGIMISYVTSSAISLLNYMATAEGVHSYVIWGMGNFSGVGFEHLLPFSLVVVVGLSLSLALVKPLNALLLGENYAENLGVDIRLTRTALLFITGMLTAVVTAYCGPVSFIGLAVPHIARLLLGSVDNRKLLPLTLLAGSVLALLCNILCTLPGDDGLIPLNVVTPFFGVPVILYVLVFKRKYNLF